MYKFHTFFRRFIDEAAKLANKDEEITSDVEYYTGSVTVRVNCSGGTNFMLACDHITTFNALSQCYPLLTHPHDVDVNLWSLGGRYMGKLSCQSAEICAAHRWLRKYVCPWLLAGRLTRYSVDEFCAHYDNGARILWHRCLVCAENVPGDEFCCNQRRCRDYLRGFVRAVCGYWAIKQVLMEDVVYLVGCTLAELMTSPLDFCRKK